MTARVLKFPSSSERLQRRQQEAAATMWALIWMYWWPPAWFDALAAWESAEADRIRLEWGQRRRG
jgi:hypothetical protein